MSLLDKIKIDIFSEEDYNNIPEADQKSAATDLALAMGARQSGAITKNRDYVSSYSLKSFEGSEENSGCTCKNLRLTASMPLSTLVEYCQKYSDRGQGELRELKDERMNPYPVIYLGEYPCRISKNNIEMKWKFNGKYNNLFTPTSRHFFIPAVEHNVLVNRLCPEYIYNKKRYVRVPISAAARLDETFSTNELVDEENGSLSENIIDYVWMSVEPLQFEFFGESYEKIKAALENGKVSDEEIKLFSSNIIFSNVVFNYNRGQAIESYSFVRDTFKRQAFDLEQAPSYSYAVPKRQTRIPERAFYKCTGLSNICIHENVKYYEVNALDGLADDIAITFDIPVWPIQYNRAIFGDSYLANIYVHKNENKITITGYPSLKHEAISDCYPFSIEKFNELVSAKAMQIRRNTVDKFNKMSSDKYNKEK